jgi:hypothetical protein
MRIPPIPPDSPQHKAASATKTGLAIYLPFADKVSTVGCSGNYGTLLPEPKNGGVAESRQQ